MEISQSSLLSALHLAIQKQEIYEKEHLKYTSDSGLLMQWKEAKEAVKRGENLYLKY